VLVGVALAAAIVAGVDWRVVALAAVAAHQPWLVGVAAVVWAVVSRRRTSGRVSAAVEATFLSALASELRGGASLRSGLVDAAARVPDVDLGRAVRRARSGMPIERLAVDLSQALSHNGTVVSGAIRITSSTGAGAAETIDALADRAVFVADLERERRALTAQAKLSAAVVGGAPFVVAAGLLLSGRGGVLLSHGTMGVAVLGIGLGLELAGLAVVAVMLRRVR